MNDFQITSKLGEGAYSTVYKVRRLIDGNIYALKKVKLINLSEKERKNALNEVRLLASIKSKFVISYKEAFFDEKDNTLGMVMEFADGGDLYQKIVENRKTKRLFEESDIWRIFIQLVKGLKALHELNILHRDLKSANVFLMQDGSVKLGDLNVSKVARKGMGYTQTGTPYYASPEVWNDKPYDTKSDIWSLGCVLYEMITLRPPFRAQNMEGLYKRVIEGRFNRIPSKFTNDLFKIVQLLLQVSPEKRPSCADILKNPIILKRIEYFKNYSGEDNSEDQALLKTILVPKNLLVLSEKLPKPNYGYRSVNNKKVNINYNLNDCKNFNSDLKINTEETDNNLDTNENNNNNKKEENNNINNNTKEKEFNNIKIIKNSNNSNNINENKSYDEINNKIKSLIMKNNEIKSSISKGQLPSIKRVLIKSDNLKEAEKKDNINNMAYNYNSDNIRKKNKIFDILNKKNLIRVNQINKLYKPYNINKIRKNDNSNLILNINSNIVNNNNKVNNFYNIYKENAFSKKPSKIKLNPIKKNLLNIC